MKWLIKACLVFIILAMFGNSSAAAEATDAAWAYSQPVTLSERVTNESLSDESSCPGRVTMVPVGKEHQFKSVCMYGLTTTNRLARYLDASGTYHYAFAFGNSILFYDVKGICESSKYCAYSYSEDVLLAVQAVTPWTTGHTIIGSFSDTLTYSSEGYYVYNALAETKHIGPGGQLYPSSSIAISDSGHWAVVELWNYGLVRVNLKDLTIRRIGITGVPYGQGADPRFELAISDSGNLIATAGSQASHGLYVIDDTCGDELGVGATTYFQQGTVACPMIGLLQDVDFSGVVSTHTPRFSTDGQKVSLFVITTTKRSIVTLGTMPQAVASIGYAAFGDSFTSGQGETSDEYYEQSTNTATNHCHVSTRSYPYLLGNDWGVSAKNFACSGATSQQVRAEVIKWSQDIGIVPTISLGVGGNDIDMMGKLSTCTAPDTCEWANIERRASTAFEIQALLPRLVETILDVKQAYFGAAIFVVGYPSVINSEPFAQCSISLALLLNRDERLYIDESIRLLNIVIATAAAITHIRYVDIQDAFVGERLCDGSQSAMNAIRLGDDIAPFDTFASIKLIGSESFHPTPHGHQLVYQKIKQQLSGGWQDNECETCDPPVAMSTYWSDTPSATEQLIHQVSQTFLTTKDIIAGSIVRYLFPPGTFQPFAPVWLELHSAPISLARAVAAADGSLQGSLAIPSNIEGYHTMHAYSQSKDLSLLDVYETVSVDKLSSAQEVLMVSHSIQSSTSSVLGSVLRAHSDQPTSHNKLANATLQMSPDNKNGPATTVSTTANNQPIQWFFIGSIGAAGAVLVMTLGVYRLKRRIAMDGDKGS